MLVILMGAIGGMLVWGIAGLFVGSVILVWCWEALDFWIIKHDETPTEKGDATEKGDEGIKV
jgi:predicted PurR-regulated permease PerM